MQVLYAFGLVFLLSIVLIDIVRFNARKWKLVDMPNGRSQHNTPTPRAGGIGFFLAPAMVTPFFFSDLIVAHWLSFFALFLVFLVGVLDDHRDIAPRTKFIGIISASVLLCLDGICIDSIGVFFSFPVLLGWFAVPFTVFAVVGLTNAVNLIDGLDGLAASVSLVILIAFLMIGFTQSDMLMIVLSATFIAGLSAFLLFNWYPAAIFMGDSGSLTLGFVISLLAIRSLDYYNAVSVLFITALPIVDTFSVMIRRKMNKKSMLSADKCHCHHVLATFFDQRVQTTVLFLALVQIMYILIGFQLDQEKDQSLSLILFLTTIMMIYLLLRRMIERQGREC